MKNMLRTSLALSMALVLTAILTSTAFAADVGTDAGTSIDNTANITYSIGGVPQAPQDSNTASVLVDNLVDLSMTGTDTANVSGTDQAIIFTIRNDGNETQSYQVTFYAESTTDSTDMTFASVNSGLYLDNDASGDLSAGDTTIQLNPVSGTYYPITVDVAPDATVDILLVGDTPGGVTSGQTAEYTLVAQTLDESTIVVTTDDGGSADVPGAIDVVLTDGEAQSTDAVDGVPALTDQNLDGKYLASATYTFQGSGVTVNKTYVVLWDPINGSINPKAIPGAYVTFTIEVDNAAGSPVSVLNQVTDSLNAALALDVHFVTSAGPGNPTSGDNLAFEVTHTTGRTSTASPLYYTDGTPDGVIHAAGLITATFSTLLPAVDGYAAGELQAGETATLTFNAIIQ